MLAMACYLVRRGGSLTQKNDQGKEPLDFPLKKEQKNLLQHYSNLKINCLICHKFPKAVTFYPCGHRISCEKCCLDVNKCVVCQETIVVKTVAGGRVIYSKDCFQKPKLFYKNSVKELQEALRCSEGKLQEANRCSEMKLQELQEANRLSESRVRELEGANRCSEGKLRELQEANLRSKRANELNTRLRSESIADLMEALRCHERKMREFS